MDLSPKPSKDESRAMDRQLYRAGQTPKPSPTAPAWNSANSSTSLPKRSSLVKGDQTPLLQRRLVRAVLAALWLLLLGGASYCVFRPDRVEEAKQEMRDLWRNKDLTREQRREKMGQIMSSLSDRQRMNMRMSPEQRVKIHDDYDAFFKLSPQQQAEQLKKEILEREKRRAEMRAKWAANGGGRRRGGGKGAQGKGAQGKGAQGKGAQGKGGPRGGGPGGGGGRGERDPTGGDMFPPETRGQMGLKRSMSRDMMKQMGIGRGGRGGRGGRPQ